jgi:hypothetical protein
VTASLTFLCHRALMGEHPEPMGAASVRWNDYVGTAAADDAEAVVHARSLYQIAGLDRDQWTIVGFDIDRWDSAHRVTVYAYDRRQQEDSTFADLLEVAEENGELPVTAFHLSDHAQVKAFRREALKRMAIRLTARALSEHRLVVQQHTAALEG